MSRFPAVASLVAVGLLGVALTSGSAGAVARGLTIYARATQVQFVDHSDDRSRGAGSNPFGVDTKAVVPLTKEKEKGKGPFPGDNALYRFKLYSDPGLTRSAGTAVYSCTFNFVRHALCDAEFDLKSSTITASGPADFTSQHFTLAITGGDNRYLGARGQVTSAPAAKNTHRLEFTIR